MYDSSITIKSCLHFCQVYGQIWWLLTFWIVPLLFNAMEIDYSKKIIYFRQCHFCFCCNNHRIISYHQKFIFLIFIFLNIINNLAHFSFWPLKNQNWLAQILNFMFYCCVWFMILFARWFLFTRLFCDRQFSSTTRFQTPLTCRRWNLHVMALTKKRSLLQNNFYIIHIPSRFRCQNLIHC